MTFDDYNLPDEAPLSFDVAPVVVEADLTHPPLKTEHNRVCSTSLDAITPKGLAKELEGLMPCSRAPGRAARADKEPETGSVFGAILQKTILCDDDVGLIVVGIQIGLPEGAEGRR